MIVIKRDVDDMYADRLGEAVQIVEGIASWCKEKSPGYTEGWRNDVAVDLCSALRVLGYMDDADWDEFFVVYCGADPDSARDFRERSEVLDEYIERWYDDGAIFEKMLLREKWIGYAILHENKLFAIV